MVFQFASTKQATAFYRQLYAFTVRCRTVTASFHGTVRLTTQSLKKTHLGRLPAFLAKQTLFATGFPATINDTLATVSGRDVLFIDAVGHHPPTKPALTHRRPELGHPHPALRPPRSRLGTSVPADGLAGHPRDHPEVAVVMQQRQPVQFRDRGDHEVDRAGAPVLALAG